MEVAIRRVVIASLLILPILQASAAAEQSCGRAPRIIGAFGAENSVQSPISISDDIRSQLRGLVAVRQVLKSQLSPSGEQIVIYDTAGDESDPHPEVAFVVNAKVQLILGDTQLNDRGGGFVRFLAACPFHLDPDRKAVALAFSRAFDGTGSVFLIVMWQSGTFKIAFTAHGNQGQLVIGQDKLSLWTSNGDGECVWCGQHYTVTHFTWRNERFIKIATSKPKKSFDPSVISGQPLNFAD
jgi:hypothetical protein